MAKQFDLVIFGSGSTAFAAALHAAELGKTVAMTESRTLGGTCVNRGCLPSKNLIEAAAILHEAQHPRYPGFQATRIPVDFGALVGQKDAVIADYRKKKYESILSDKIAVFTGEARFVNEREITVGSETLRGERFLVATGTRPVVLDIPGLASVPYLTSDLLTSAESMELKTLPESLVCIGAGYIGLELGQMFARFGTKVTILNRSPHLLPGYEPEISQSVAESFAAEGIEVLQSIEVRKVENRDGRVFVETQSRDGRRTLEASHLLVAAGRIPNTEKLHLDLAHVELDKRGFVAVNDELRTSNPNVFAAGDVIGSNVASQMATPVGAQDGVIAAQNALGSNVRRVSHSVIPRAIFLDPQVAVVGMTDEEANRNGFTCSCRSVPMSLVPRAGAVRKPAGVIKMVAEEKTKKVLGVSMHGMNASEVIHEAAMGMRLGATIDDFAGMLHVYPTMAEALKIVALSFTKDVRKMSCCAE